MKPKIRDGLAQPRRAFRALMELTRGYLVRLSCRLRGVRFRAGRNLRVAGRLVVRGPGLVVFGDDVRVDGRVTPWTYREDALIEIGSGTYLNGASFGAMSRITVGPLCIIGRASIMDTDFHSTRANRHDPAAPIRVAPVVLEENVWIGAQVGILPGTRVGRNSVVGFGSVCSGTYPPNMIIAGNPARPVKPIPEQ